MSDREREIREWAKNIVRGVPAVPIQDTDAVPTFKRRVTSCIDRAAVILAIERAPLHWKQTVEAAQGAAPLDASDPVAQAKFSLHRLARTTEDAQYINRIVGGLAARLSEGAAPRAEGLDRLLELAWGVIANAGWDDMGKSPGWQEAASRWRDEYHAYLASRPTCEFLTYRDGSVDCLTHRWSGPTVPVTRRCPSDEPRRAAPPSEGQK